MQKYKILVGELFADVEQKTSLGKEGDVVELGQMTEEFINTCLENNLIEVVPAEEVKKEDVPAEEAKKEDAPAEEAATAPAEEAAAVTPQKFYRGSLIVEEAPRTVGAQTFQHIKTVEGHDYDLTQEEYSKDVTVK